jgi:SAM-dependent methyltransferase
MTFRHPLAFPLGMEGVALLRAYAGDFADPGFSDARVAEVRAMLAAYDRGELGAADEIGDVDTVAGYRAWSAYYDTEDNPLFEVEEPLVRSILADIKAGRALDAACGTGRYSAFLARLGHRVVGVDGSPDMLAKARPKVPEARFLEGELTALPLPHADVDLIVCALAVTHVPALGPVLSEFARVLRPGGHVVLSDIHWMSLYLGGIASARTRTEHPDACRRAGSCPATTWRRRCRSASRCGRASSRGGRTARRRAARGSANGPPRRPTPRTRTHRPPSSGISSYRDHRDCRKVNCWLAPSLHDHCCIRAPSLRSKPFTSRHFSLLRLTNL